MADHLDTPAAPATLMDGIYRHQRHIYDASRHYYLLGRDRMIGELKVPAGGTVLEIGCGTARNLVAAAETWPDARLYGIDISSEMLKSAAAKIGRQGLSERISVARADAADVDCAERLGPARFDRIFFSYSLSMMPPWRRALAVAVSNLAPGGELHIVDFSGQRGLPRWFAGGLQRWLGLFHVSPRPDLGEELDRLARQSGGTVHMRSLYRDYALLARLVRPRE